MPLDNRPRVIYTEYIRGRSALRNVAMLRTKTPQGRFLLPVAGKVKVGPRRAWEVDAPSTNSETLLYFPLIWRNSQMPIPAVNQLAFQIVIQGQSAAAGSNAKSSYNVFNYRRASGVPAITKAALNTAFQANVIPAILAAMNARYSPLNLTIRCLNDALDAPQSFAVAGAGAIATDSLPSDAAIYFLFRTSLRGRNYRGSKHFGPASEIDTTGDVLTGAGLARWQTVQTALALNFVDANANTWIPQVVSTTLSNLVTNPTNVVTNDVTQVLLDLNVGTMRRRRARTVR